MQKSMLLVAVALAGAGAGEAYAGDYVLANGATQPNYPVLTSVTTTFNTDSQGTVNLSIAPEEKTTIWDWEPDDPYDVAPSRDLRVTTNHSAGTVVTVDSNGNTSALGYLQPFAVLDSPVAHVWVNMN